MLVTEQRQKIFFKNSSFVFCSHTEFSAIVNFQHFKKYHQASSQKQNKNTLNTKKRSNSKSKVLLIYLSFIHFSFFLSIISVRQHFTFFFGLLKNFGGQIKLIVLDSKLRWPYLLNRLSLCRAPHQHKAMFYK